MTRSRRPLLLAFVVVVIVVAAAVWYARRGSGQPNTVAVTRGNLAQTIETTGTFQPADPVIVRGQVSGSIQLLAVQPGDRVEKGDILAQLDRAPFQRALDTARRALDSAEFAETFALATPVADTLQAKAGALAAVQHVADARAALAAAQHDLDGTAILAPSAGTIVDVQTGDGQPYQAGAPLATINRGDGLQVSADLDEVDVPHVPLGTRVQITADAFPSTTLDGTVASIAAVGTQQGGGTVFPAVISLGNLAGLDIRPGMTASIAIPSAVVENAVLVPAGAIKTVGRRSFVTVVAGGKSRTVEVTTGLRANGMVQIAAGDVKPGDRVEAGDG